MHDYDNYIEANLNILTHTNLLNDLIHETNTGTDLPQMLSGPQVGSVLKLFVQLLNARNILEIGTFTGYATICMAEGLANSGSITTLEINPKHATLAQKFFDRTPYSHQINLILGPAIESIHNLENKNKFDLIFCDADKENYLSYYRVALSRLKSGGLLIFDNALWSGEVINPKTNAAKNINAVNKYAKQDSRVNNLLLPVRDGLLIIRKK